MPPAKLKSAFRRLKHAFTLKADAGPVGIGLVGIGGWGTHNAVEIMTSKRFHVKGLYDIDRNLSRKLSERFRIKSFESYEALLASPDIAAVSLTVPNPLHGPMIKRAAEAGKHIFIEKPLASTSGECRFLDAFCRERDVLLFIGHQLRREPVFQKMKEILDSGEPGAPLFARGLRTLRRNPADTKSWRCDPGSCPGGSMEQLGIHLVDVMIHLFGPILSARGIARNIPFTKEAPDWGHLELEFKNDLIATVESSFSSPDALLFEIFCEHGGLRYDGKSLFQICGDTKKRIRFLGPSGGVAQFHAFADCIEGRKEPDTDAANSTMIMEAVSRMTTPTPQRGRETEND